MLRTFWKTCCFKSAISTNKRLFSAIANYSSPDGTFEKDKIANHDSLEGNSRDFTYFLLGADRMIFASLARLTLIKVRFDN